jgi:hypothetical protein
MELSPFGVVHCEREPQKPPENTDDRLDGSSRANGR